jgi:hypothetical protein
MIVQLRVQFCTGGWEEKNSLQECSCEEKTLCEYPKCVIQWDSYSSSVINPLPGNGEWRHCKGVAIASPSTAVRFWTEVNVNMGYKGGTKFSEMQCISHCKMIGLIFY